MNKLFFANIIFAVLFFNSNFILAGVINKQDLLCYDSGKISYTYNRQIKVELSAYCFDAKTQTLISKSCYNGNCQALQQSKNGFSGLSESSIGNPGFATCLQLGGIPQSIRLHLDVQQQTNTDTIAKIKWHKSSRCLFADGSYVNLAFLL